MVAADETADQAADAPAGELLIDPFAFHVGVASRILGLGGNVPGYDHGYAFHTPYVEAAPGPAHFTLRFTGLTARRGTLQLWVNMLPTEPGGRARVANSQRVQLNRIVKNGGQHVIPFDSFKGVSFALHGQVVDETDAEAAALVVALDRPARPEDAGAALVEARTTSYGRTHAKPAAHLITLGRPTLAHPMSQCATARQLDEPAARDMPAGASALDRWRLAYVLRALESYGVLQPGARGLGLEDHATGLAPLIRARGPEVVLATAAADPAGDRVFDPAALPHDLANYDFLWSAGIAARLGAPRDAIRFGVDAIQCVRPGGLLIHLLPFAPDGTASGTGSAIMPFVRNNVEQLALMLIAQKHEVAQLRIEHADPLVEPLRDPANPDDPGVPASEYGLIVRRQASAY